MMDYKLIAKKTVHDIDGFTTDYCWYQDLATGDYFFIIGDEDIYDADPDYADYETSDYEVAQEWFDNYDTEDEDTLDEDVAVTTSGDAIEGEMTPCGTQFIDENGEKHPVNDAGEVVMDEILDDDME